MEIETGMGFINLKKIVMINVAMKLLNIKNIENQNLKNIIEKNWLILIILN